MSPKIRSPKKTRALIGDGMNEARLDALQRMFETFIFGELVRMPDPIKALEGIRLKWLDHDRATDEYRAVVNDICGILAAMCDEYRRRKN